MACEEVVQSRPASGRRRCAGAAIEDFSLAMIDPWAAGYTGPEDDPAERRIVRPLTWVRSEPGEHGYARPVEGLVVTSWTSTRWRSSRSTTTASSPLPPQPGNYDPERMAAPDNVPRFAAPRADVKPIEITQPEGASFTVDGHDVALAEVARAASASRRARASSCTRSATRTGHAAPDHLPRVAGGDVRPLRRSGADAPLQERLRPWASTASAGWRTR